MISKNVLQADARKNTRYGLAAGCQVFNRKIYGYFLSKEEEEEEKGEEEGKQARLGNTSI